MSEGVHDWLVLSVRESARTSSSVRGSVNSEQIRFFSDGMAGDLKKMLPVWCPLVDLLSRPAMTNGSIVHSFAGALRDVFDDLYWYSGNQRFVVQLPNSDQRRLVSGFGFARSSYNKAGATEGDDVLLLLRLAPDSTPLATGLPEYRDINRYPGLGRLLDGINKLLCCRVFPNYGGDGSPRQPPPVGTYLVIGSEATQVLAPDVVVMLVAFLYYGYLSCVRVERMLRHVNLDAAWEDVARNVIFIRKKVANIKRYFLIKHRSKSPRVVACYKELFGGFRISDQAEMASDVVSEMDMAIRVSSEYSSHYKNKFVVAILNFLTFVSFPLLLTAAYLAVPLMPFQPKAALSVLDEQTEGILWWLLGLGFAIPAILGLVFLVGYGVRKRFRAKDIVW